jgi:triosephosphate isomerase (TIM)
MRKIIIANWKMNKTAAETVSFIKELKRLVKGVRKDIVICPPFVSLQAASKVKGRLGIGGQDIYFERQGAFTGEISAMMLKEFAGYVLIGHSERRSLFGETDRLVNSKLKASLEAGLMPVVCLGETRDERDRQLTKTVLERQLKEALAGIGEAIIKDLIIAYEPVWAISGGNLNKEPATPWAAQIEHAGLKEMLKALYPQAGKKIRIVYGGSVKPENAAQFLAQKDIDGCLVGNASLDPESFAKICRA